MVFKQILKKICPTKIWSFIHIKRLVWETKKYQRSYRGVLRKLEIKQEPIIVLFMATYGSAWKYDSLYKFLLQDTLFTPIILVCPVVDRGMKHLIETMNSCCECFKKKGYDYIRTYDESTNQYFDAHTLKPDIIFYTSPYSGLMDKRYFMTKFDSVLTGYIDYGYNSIPYEWGCNMSLHQQVWRYYLECEDILKMVRRYSPIFAKNCVVTGFPMYDAFIYGTSIGRDWKLNDGRHKKIIWSPHHTIDGRDYMIKFSTFLLYYDVMWRIADKYKDAIEFAFKPHPLLKNHLYEHPDWGKERTDKYYEKWENGLNTTIVDGDYVDLFNSSDAMINDSASFTIEYLYMKKPCLFLSNYNREKEANEVALKAYECWYHALNEEEIEKFISDIVLDGKDIMKNKRESFYNDILVPPHGLSVAENIVRDIKNAIKK